MAEDFEDEAARAAMGTDSLGSSMAMGAGPSPEARAYLREQIELARLQKQNLLDQNEFELSHLRWRRFNDQMKGAMQIMIVALGLLLVIAVIAAMWAAAHADGVVIEAFKVPPDMAEKGLTGDVVASQLLDRLSGLQAQTDSSRAPDTYASNWGGDIKVEIPDTGVSISEAYRYLTGWLGHETHISGELYHTGKGIVLSTRVGGNTGARFEGPEADLDKLVTHAAEAVFAQTQPYRYAIYLSASGRFAEEERALSNLALNGPDSEKPWAYTVWAYNAPNLAEVLRRAQKAVALEPDLPLATNNLSTFQAIAGHDEEALQAAQATIKSLDGAGAAKVIPRSAAVMRLQNLVTIDEDLGDFRDAVARNAQTQDIADFEASHRCAFAEAAADAVLAHDIAAARNFPLTDSQIVLQATEGFGWELTNFRLVNFERYAALGDWRAARADMERALAPPALHDRVAAALPAQLWPRLALADAEAGDFKAATAVIGKTPLDCYPCLETRGNIDAVRKNWNGAAFWFARAVRQASSLPFAYADWGQMLLARGDPDGAIAKFTLANQKGPHFADPLEMWGEALIAKNRSDLALAKFEEADKYAPNWGRLHLKWGEALLWSGDNAGAKAQFATAARLDMTPAEKSELARVARE